MSVNPFTCADAAEIKLVKDPTPPLHVGRLHVTQYLGAVSGYIKPDQAAAKAASPLRPSRARPDLRASLTYLTAYTRFVA